MRQAAAEGRFPFKAPLGYLNIYTQRGPNLIQDPDRAPLIRRAFELFAEGTRTKSSVLELITQLGFATHSGKQITAQTFQRLMKNPIYAGWVEIPSWGVRERGGFEQIVDQDLFDRVQDILVGRRPSFTSYQRNHPDFPLRLWMRCGSCNDPLTGSWSKGRKKKYACYRCRNRKCKAVNIARAKLESLFVEFLDRLTPEDRDMDLFERSVRKLCAARQITATDLMSASMRQLEALSQKKDQLVDFFLAGKIAQETYDSRLVRLSAEIESVSAALRDAETQQYDIDAVQRFARDLIAQPAKLWMRSTCEGKRRLQKALF